MAIKRRQQEIIETLHANGVRKRVAAAIAGARGGSRKKSEGLARDVLKQLETASDTIRDEILGGSRKRKEAAKKAAATRKRNEAKRKATGKKAAATRAKTSAKSSGSRAKSASKRSTTRAKGATKRTASRAKAKA
jgi:hypothetical protein